MGRTSDNRFYDIQYAKQYLFRLLISLRLLPRRLRDDLCRNFARSV